jgi:hypothetical protein
MARRAFVLLCAVAALSVPTTAAAAVATKPPGKLRVCGQGPAGMDVFVDKADARTELHKEKRDLGAGACASFPLPKGRYAVTVVGRCADARDAELAGLAVTPESRGLYHDTTLAGARVVRESTTTWTATWECAGAPSGGTPLEGTPPSP